MDPLTVLREHTIRNDLESIKQVGDEFHFGDEYKFPCNIETAYRSKQGSLYTLESLVFFVKNTHTKHTEYMQQARALKLQIVTFTDRKPLQDYLEGRVQTTDAIELLAPTAPLLPPLRDDRDNNRVPAEDVEEYRPEDPSFGPHSKRMRLDVDGGDATAADYAPKEVDTTRLISLMRERERPIRDRDTILLCHNKDFQGILAMLTKRDDEKKKADEQQRKEPEKQAEAGPPLPTPNPSSRYANVEEKRFWKEHLGTDAAEELGIDPTQSYIVGSTKLKDAVKPKPPIHRPHNQPTPRPSAPIPTQKAKAEGPPIILVPSAFQTMLNIYNAKDFLEDGVYVAPDIKAKLVSKKPELVPLLRKMGRDTPVKYEVRDKPAVLSSKDWERVVAVFVLGKEWQFKDWPFKDHVEVFSKIMGIFLRFEDDSVESAKVVKQWNVKIISLSKHKRHQDRTAVLEFWDTLDAFIRARRMNLVF